jgi:hypothetical protein
VVTIPEVRFRHVPDGRLLVDTPRGRRRRR